MSDYEKDETLYYMFRDRTAEETTRELACRVAAIRKGRKLTQKELAQRAGVKYGVVRKFEQTGKITLLSLTKIAMELGMEEHIESLFYDVPLSIPFDVYEKLRQRKFHEVAERLPDGTIFFKTNHYS